jgi:hypothetical protein
MDLLTIAAHVNVVIGGLGATAYALWAVKWYRRQAWRLFIFNLLSCFGLIIFAGVFMSIIIGSNSALPHGQAVLRYLVPLTIGMPVLTRLIEYRRDHLREAYARRVVEGLERSANELS